MTSTAKHVLQRLSLQRPWPQVCSRQPTFFPSPSRVTGICPIADWSSGSPGQERPGRVSADSGTPLPAGPGDPVRRSSRRQLQAQPARRGEPELPVHRLLRRPLHGGDRRYPLARRRSRSTCPTWPPAAAWPTWPTWTRSRRPGPTSARSSTPDDLMPVTYINSTADLKAFCGRHGGIVCTSSNARAVLEWAFAQPSPGPLLPGPAPRPEHGPDHGNPARADDRLGSPSRPGRQHRRRRSTSRGPALEGPLLGPPDVQARARRRSFGANFRESRSWSIPNA